jgi:hypothetical protein
MLAHSSDITIPERSINSSPFIAGTVTKYQGNFFTVINNLFIFIIYMLNGKIIILIPLSCSKCSRAAVAFGCKVY